MLKLLNGPHTFGSGPCFWGGFVVVLALVLAYPFFATPYDVGSYPGSNPNLRQIVDVSLTGRPYSVTDVSGRHGYAVGWYAGSSQKALTFGKVFYLGPAALPWFYLCLFFLGLGGANFAVYTLWLPEQYPTECRASAFAFATSFARFGGAGITFLVGAGVQHYGSLGTPVAWTSLAFLVGLALLPFGAETRGQVLPS